MNNIDPASTFMKLTGKTFSLETSNCKFDEISKEVFDTQDSRQWGVLVCGKEV
jgi:hypothetical protein